MSVHPASWAWRVDLAALEELPEKERVAAHVARAVVVKLGDNANDLGESSPSVPLIAYETELGERTVQRALRALESIGVVESRPRVYATTVYVLRMLGGSAAPLKVILTELKGAGAAPSQSDAKGAADDAARVPETTLGAAPAPSSDGKGAAPAPALKQELKTKNLNPPTPLQPPGDQAEEIGGDLLSIELALSVELNRSPITATEKRDWRRAARELCDAGATIVDIKARCGEYRRIWPTAKLVPLALTRHWSLLGGTAELEQPDSTLDGWIEKTAWKLPADAIADILASRGIPEPEIAQIVERCAELLADHQRGVDTMAHVRSAVA